MEIITTSIISEAEKSDIYGKLADLVLINSVENNKNVKDINNNVIDRMKKVIEDMTGNFDDKYLDDIITEKRK